MSQRTKKISSLLISCLILIVFIVPFFVQAQGGNPASGPIIIVNPFNCGGQANCTIYTFIKTVINDILIPVGAVIAVLMVMYAGFLYVTARGNAAQISKAHQALLWAVIGAAILLGAWVISEAIQSTITNLKT